MDNIWYLQKVVRFLAGIPFCVKDTWEISHWSRYRNGHVRDQLEALNMHWNALVTACILHHRAKKQQKNVRSLR